MKKRILFLRLFISFILAMTGCKTNKPTDGSNKTIDLIFKPMPVTTLSTVPFDDKWELIDSHTAVNVSGVEQILINLYQKDSQDPQAILQDRNGFYDLELTIEDDPSRLAVYTQDLTHDEALELVVTVDRGTTYKEVKVYSFDGDQWKCILDTENLLSLDLSGDGKDELITVSMGSLPGYVWIYRWEKEQFEKCDLVEALNAVYAVIITKEGKNLIEAGKENNPRLYRYDNGRLLEIKS